MSRHAVTHRALAGGALALLALAATPAPATAGGTGTLQAVITAETAATAPSAVDTVTCAQPLLGNACLKVQCANCANQPIGGAGGDYVLAITESLLNASGYGGCTAYDVNSAVWLTHQRTGDINVQVARAGDYAVAWTGGGICDATTLDAVFDDEAAGQANACPAAGNLRPNDALTPFDGKDLAAEWTLAIGGNGATTGTLRGWKLAADVYCTTLPPPSCLGNATATCLNESRFRVEARYETAQGASGAAGAYGLTGDTGWLWFFAPQNVEVVIKVLNGCGLNNRYWVFAAGLTNVKVRITVTDTLTGRAKTYNNPLDHDFSPIYDTSAFPCS